MSSQIVSLYWPEVYIERTLPKPEIVETVDFDEPTRLPDNFRRACEMPQPRPGMTADKLIKVRQLGL